MRLTQLKLAGFKSFVDTTTLHIHGQRVGVVGPNGCGKSNVMESVRWVLGESSAKEMRADAMDAVIFNGSANRKPISRASVELVFDNSLGGASGEWSQYAEISVKRVIERDKGSTYYINNTVVRRRDVADLFLGTGLGGRAYAIIGQNTISRIVEARPEEVRVFLEEAAGISKYKERRRETELRLRDTRENLVRVEDIIRELSKQITRLQAQALVAERYHQLQTTLKLAQGQVWWLKKRDAGSYWEKSQRQVEKLVNELEAQMATLRNGESALESLRQTHLAVADGVNLAQAKYYEANAEVSNLEQQVQHTAEARSRVQMQLQQLTDLLKKNTSQIQGLQENLKSLHEQHDLLIKQENQAQQHVQVLHKSLPLAEATMQAGVEAFNQSQSALLETEQRIRLDSASINHISQNIVELNQRLNRLTIELTDLHLPDERMINSTLAEYQAKQTHIFNLEQKISTMREQAQAQQQLVQRQRESAQLSQRQFNQLEAEIASLMKIQQSMQQMVGGQAELSQWLKQYGLENNTRLWQKFSIKKGWGVAIEAVLGARLNALDHIELTQFNLDNRPPTALVLLGKDTKQVSLAQVPVRAMTPAFSVIENIDDALKTVMQTWLANIYILNESDDIEQLRRQLAANEMLVSATGDIFTAFSVSYYGAQEIGLHGVLDRQLQLKEAQNSLPTLQLAAEQQEQVVQHAEQDLQIIKQQIEALAIELRVITQSAHQLNLELQRLQQLQLHVQDRRQVSLLDKKILEDQLQKLQIQKQEKQSFLNEASVKIEALQLTQEQMLHHKSLVELAYSQERNAVQLTEKNHQESIFNLRINNNSIKELNDRLNLLNDEMKSLKIRRNEADATLGAVKMETLKSNLEAAINVKKVCEIALATARNALSESEQNLQIQERLRMQNEQLLYPLRDKLEQSRLVEQEARLAFEQCQSELNENGLNEVELSHDLSETSKSESFEIKAKQLQAEIEVLGAVNLAAIQELATELERKDYLDSQCKDLAEASETLEDAIRKIDKETRGKLQHTFDEVNKQFNALFGTLFNGGQARLELLGDEILDTGMQVFAQPPGKKNTTIHLLSGGEKALTAIALVFALFKLNPSPFCLMDEVDAPLDDSNTERFCNMVKLMSNKTQFMFVSHNKTTMEMAQQLIGVTMQESGVSRIVEVDIEAAMQMVA